MPKKKINNMIELTKQINTILKETLNNKNSLVAEEIKRTESDMVEQEVYSKYEPDNGEPWVYKRRDGGRRGKDGGLADMRNMWHEAVESRGKVSMLIMNLTPPNPAFNDNNLKDGQVAQLVEGGLGAMGLRYSYTKNRGDTHGIGQKAENYLAARPFQKETFNTLQNNKMHIQVLALELRKKGLNVTML